MVTKKGTDSYTKLLNAKQADLRQATESLLNIIAGTSAAEKRSAVERFNSILKIMATVIPEDETPHWIKRCRSTSDQYLNELERDPNAPRELLTSIAQYYGEIRNHKWHIEDEPEGFTGVDFSEINTRIYTESEMPELFNKLAQLIQEVVDSDQVDSITAKNTLQTIIDSINRNSQKDAFSAKMFWTFGRAYLRNVVPEIIRITKVGAAILDAYSKTVDEIGFGLEAVVDKIEGEILSVTSTKLPAIEEMAAKAIHAPEIKALPGPADSLDDNDE